MIRWMKGHKGVILVASFIFFLLALAAYADRRERTVLRLGIYADSSWDVPQGQQYQWIDEVIANFEAQHPGVDVVYESGVLKKDYTNWLADKIVLGQAPDVFMLLEEDLNVFAATGALVDITNRMADDLDPSVFYEVSLNAGAYGSGQYALPLESNPMMICINTDLLEKEGIPIPESGWTLEEFYAICQQVTKDTDGDGVIDQFGLTDYSWKQAMLAYGQPLFDRSGTQVYLNTDKTKSALDFMMKLESLSGSYRVTNEDFDEGRVAFLPMTLAQYRTYRPYPYHISKYSSFAWTCIELPSETKAINATPVETSLISMSSTTNHRQLAWNLMRYLSTDQQVQQDLVKTSQGVSVLKEVMADSETAAILEGDNVVAAALTLPTLESMMADAVAQPKFKIYNPLLERADYLIQQSLEAGTIEVDLIGIQKELEQELQ